MPSSKALPKPSRAALYARVSTSGKGQDVEVQLAELRQVAEQRGWVVVGVYADEGISGSKGRRPALDRLMDDARRGKLDIVAVVRFDRFARSTRHLLTALEDFRTMGVDFVSLREQVDTSTPMGKAMFTIIAAVAELEKDIIRERVVAGIAKAKADGVHCGRPKTEIDLRAPQALLAQGLPLREVADMLGVSRSTLRRRLHEAGELSGGET